MNKFDLIKELTFLTKGHMSTAEQFLSLTKEELNKKHIAESWSILECLAHLNLYGDFYVPEITQRINNSKHADDPTFKSGVLGNYFSNSMKPKDKLNSMKTFKSMDPINSDLDKSCIENFLVQQDELLKLLEKCHSVNLIKTKTSISISKWIKLRLGDTLKVVIYHNWRHIEQAKRLMN